jgi:3D (Asp-Asp-Asp) domain-containing protein
LPPNLDIERWKFYHGGMSRWVKILAISLLILMGVALEFPLEAENLNSIAQKEDEKIFVIENNSLLGIPNLEKNEGVLKILAIVTGYSSTPWETDGDPYVTASGEIVRDGIVANNLFPFGTKIKIPEIFGDKIFVVEDRMSFEKSNYQFDVWFDDYFEALKFGTKKTYVEILPY